MSASEDRSSLVVQLHKLRPAKIRNAISRRWFEYQVPRLDLRPIAGLVDLGGDYGGWRLPVGSIDPSWVCYMIGAGGQISVDIALARDYGATVRTFDAVAEYVERAREQAAETPRITAYQAAIAIESGPIRMQVTHDPNSRSVSAASLYESKRFIELPGRTLRSLMEELGDQRIDLLKLDIEGSEYEVLPTIDLRELGVKVFATQLHHTASVSRARELIAELAGQGYEPVACIPAVKITFVHRELL
jgi:FkbM family methyltransferase